jgi:hypothetical protein
MNGMLQQHLYNVQKFISETPLQDLSADVQPPVTSDDLLLVIDQERHVESKRLDALSNLADLLVSVNSWVARVWFQRCRTKVRNF